MRILKITAFLCSLLFLSNCAFMPRIAFGAKKGFDALKGSIGDNLKDIEKWESDSLYVEDEGYDDSLTVNEAPALDDFDYDDVEYMEASFTLSKMNVLYIGVDNPCRIFVTNVPSEHIEVESSENIEVIEREGGFYILRATKPGSGHIGISAGDFYEEYAVRIKRIPDPVAKLGTKGSRTLSVEAFKAHGGVGMWLMDYDFEARCKATSFDVTRITADGSKETVSNEGGKYEAAAKDLIDKATAGDIYLFENVKAKCPADIASRRVNSMVFRIE